MTMSFPAALSGTIWIKGWHAVCTGNGIIEFKWGKKSRYTGVLGEVTLEPAVLDLF